MVSGAMVVTSDSRVPVSVTSCGVTVVAAGSVTLAATWSEAV